MDQELSAFVAAFVPHQLRVMGPRGLWLWQWWALPIIAVVAVALGFVLGRISRLVFDLITRKTTVAWDDKLVGLLSGPLAWLWSILVARGMVALIDLPKD